MQKCRTKMRQREKHTTGGQKWSGGGGGEKKIVDGAETRAGHVVAYFLSFADADDRNRTKRRAASRSETDANEIGMEIGPRRKRNA